MQPENNTSDILDSLKCPITYELFRDPVIGSDGHTYERANITAWIQKHATSPITREPMALTSLRPNYIVRKMVEDFVSLSLQKQYQFRLDVDVCKTKLRPIFQSAGKTIYEAKWMLKHGPPIILIKIDGAKATREASFYVKLSCHPHIVRTYGLVNSNSPDSIMLVQEYAPEGDLNELLRSNHFQPTIEVLLEIFWQIVDAMICLADNHIIHGDLACRNVLVFRSSSTQKTEILVKLTDFGLTRCSSLFSIIDSPASATVSLIPIRYAAPEILLDTSSISYSEKSDVYSFGVLMWEALSGGAVPFGDIKASEGVYQERLKGKLLQRPMKCTDEIWNIILNCTQQEPNKRPNFKNIQNDLIGLRFQNKRESVYRNSQIESTYMNITNMNLSSSNNISNSKSPTEIPIYHNFNNFSNTNKFSQSIDAKQSMCEYYMPCEYCLQSINNEDFESHKNVCKIRRIVVSFVQLVIQLPPLEITSCQYCDYLIPLNMFNIHQKTCNQYSSNLYNKSPTPSSPPLEDAYVTFNYLKPVSFVKPQVNESSLPYALIPDVQNRNPIISIATQSEISNHSNMEQESTTERKTKSSKSGFRRAFSKLRRKT